MPNRYQPERRYSSPLANGEAIPNRAPIRLFAPPASPPPSAAVAASAGLTLTTRALLGVEQASRMRLMLLPRKLAQLVCSQEGMELVTPAGSS